MREHESTQQQATGAGPLHGVRVIELGSLIAGPFAGRLLADFGAEVTKIEAPDALDPLREWGQHRYRNRSLWWPVQSRGKRCITLNLRTPRGQELLRELIEDTDVLVENFRPGTLERWGIGPDALRESNPDLIVCRVSGYGQTGRYRDRAGFASVAEAVSGMRSMNGFPDRPPPRTGLSLGDSLASLFAVNGILMALYWRDTHGSGGQDVDVSLVEACFALLESAVPEFDLIGAVRQPTGTGLGRLVPSNLFRSRDERWVVIAANADKVFGRLASAIGQPGLATDPRFSTHHARAEHQRECEAPIAAWASTRDAVSIEAHMAKHGVPCAAVRTMADVFDDPYFREREMLVESTDEELGTFVGPGVTPKLSRTPGAVGRPGPWRPGADNAYVFIGRLGLNSQEVEHLEAAGVL